MRVASLVAVSCGCAGLLGSIAVGCEGDTTSRICEPGAARACAGTLGCAGTEVCDAEGSGFGPCTCGGVGGGGGQGAQGGSAAAGGSAGSGGSGASGGSGGSGGAPPDPDVCLLNNCTTDGHCARCFDGRNTCLVAEARCVACDPVSGQGCAASLECSAYGLCVPIGLTCPTDAGGDPTLVCAVNADCAACSPMHQVCDVATNQCVACTATNTQHCTGAQRCEDQSCTPNCPASCTLADDCGYCGGPGNEAHACHDSSHCGSCGASHPCPAGRDCVRGVCIEPCGVPGMLGGCTVAPDCHYCGASAGFGSWRCNLDGGTGPGGICGPPIASCADLATTTGLLPPPYDGQFRACAHDSECTGLTADFDLGEYIRDVVGDDSLDLGFAAVHICDATEDDGVALAFGMQKCGNVPLSDTASCGFCAPCREHSDCQPFSIDPYLGDLFCNGPHAASAAAVLTDMLWGSTPNHELHFLCEPRADNYGICTPCADPTHPCAS